MSELSSRAYLACPACHSRSLRSSRPTGLGEWLRRLVGFAPVRCLRCMHRFSSSSSRIRASRRAAGTLFRPQAGQVMASGPNHLGEIEAIEREWTRLLEPASLLERMWCAQLAQATWHLRCLNNVERSVMAESVARRSFNGESAVRVMEWRRSTEASIQTALDQITSLRRAGGSRPELPRDLAALAHAVGAQASGAASYRSAAMR